MSLPSTAAAKIQLTTALGDRGPQYWQTFREFLLGQISRIEFEEQVRESLNTSQLVQLHNALIISLFDTSRKAVLPPPPVEVKPRKPPKKRRRLLPYQGPDGGDMETLTSARLKKWVLGSGKRERERIRNLEAISSARPEPKARPERDEIAREAGVMLIPERGEPPGSRLPLHLAQVTRGPTLQHISDRINLISAQHNLGAPSKTVSQLMMLAFEAKLKQLISRTVSLTATSRAIASIQPSMTHSHSSVLSTPSFQTLFTISPAVLPNQSAAAMRLALGTQDFADTQSENDRSTPRSRLLVVLSERSAVRDALMSGR